MEWLVATLGSLLVMVAAYEAGFRRGWNRGIGAGYVVGQKTKPSWKRRK